MSSVGLVQFRNQRLAIATFVACTSISTSRNGGFRISLSPLALCRDWRYRPKCQYIITSMCMKRTMNVKMKNHGYILLL